MPRKPARKAATTATRPPDAETRPTVLVDAENVRRSTWPNITPDELVELSRAWAEEHEVEVVVVFEKEDETADEWLIREAGRYKPYWLVTSDRELRRRAGREAERIVGGGAFLGELIR